MWEQDLEYLVDSYLHVLRFSFWLVVYNEVWWYRQFAHPDASRSGLPSWSLGERGLPFSSRKKAYAVGEKPYMEVKAKYIRETYLSNTHWNLFRKSNVRCMLLFTVRTPPSCLLTLHTASDGKMGGSLQTRLVRRSYSKDRVYSKWLHCTASLL